MIDELKQIDPEEILWALGIRDFYRGNGYIKLSCPWRVDKNPSLQVFWGTRKNCWVWQDLGTGWTGDNLDFWCQVRGCSTSQAIREMRCFISKDLEEEPGFQKTAKSAKITFSSLQGKQGKKDGEKREKIENGRADRTASSLDKLPGELRIYAGPVESIPLLELLRDRWIDTRNLPAWLREVRAKTKPGKEIFGLAVQDEHGNWHIRTALKDPKKTKFCLKTSDKKATYSHIQNGSDNIAIVEGIFDGLTIFQMDKYADASLIILNSVVHTGDLLKDGVLKNYEKIILFLDNDNKGEKAAEKIRQAFPDKAKKMNYIYAGYKDINDWWQAEQTRQAQLSNFSFAPGF